jgi:hypothetical protein
MRAETNAGMSVEIPLQKEMFSGALVDARSDYRKRQNRQGQQPKQMALFSARETVQVGVNPRPWLKELPPPTLTLEIQDARTDEEKARDWWREAQKQIAPMFEGQEATNGPDPDGEQPVATPAVASRVDEAPKLRQIGFRAYARRTSVLVRWKGAGQSG